MVVLSPITANIFGSADMIVVLLAPF